jgi:hypothetical protein
VTERTDDTQVRTPEGAPPEVSEQEASGALAEGAGESVTPQTASPTSEQPAPAAATVDPQAAVQEPAPALDSSAATPDRSAGDSGGGDGPPAHLLIGAAFAGGLALAIVLRRLGDG